MYSGIGVSVVSCIPLVSFSSMACTVSNSFTRIASSVSMTLYGALEYISSGSRSGISFSMLVAIMRLQLANAFA